MSLDSQLEREFNFQVVSPSPETRQISIILTDPNDKLGQQNDPQKNGQISNVPACIKANHRHYPETSTFNNQRNVAIAKCTSLWSAKPKYAPKRLQQKCCLHPSRCINCPVIRNQCDDVIPVTINTNCSSNMNGISPKILVFGTSSCTQSSADYKIVSSKPKVIPKQITSFPKQIAVSTVDSCFQKNSITGSNSCCQSISDSSEDPDLPSFFQSNHARKYMCYYPYVYNRYRVPKSKSHQLCKHPSRQYSFLKQTPSCLETKQQTPQEPCVVTFSSQSCGSVKKSEIEAASNVCEQNTEAFKNLTYPGTRNDIYSPRRMYSPTPMDFYSSDSNVAMSSTMPDSINLFTSFQPSSASKPPLQNIHLMMDLTAANTVGRCNRNFESAEDSHVKPETLPLSIAEPNQTADPSPKVNHSVSTETSARSNSSSDSRVSFEFSLEAERMVSSLCSSTPIKENHVTAKEEIEQSSEPIAHFLTLICHSEQTNHLQRDRVSSVGSEDNAHCFSTTNENYNNESNEDISGSNLNFTEIGSMSKKAFRISNEQNKASHLSQTSYASDIINNGSDAPVAENSKHSKTCYSETCQPIGGEIKRSNFKMGFNERVREEETLFKKAALRGCYEISYILAESLSPGFDGIESFRKNVIEIISKADSVFGRRYILRDIVIGFLQLANCWANLYSCIGLQNEELKHGSDLHEQFWNWTCSSRKLMSGFNTFFEQQASCYAKQKTDKYPSAAKEQLHDYCKHNNGTTKRDRTCSVGQNSFTTATNAPERKNYTYVAASSQHRNSIYDPQSTTDSNSTTDGLESIGTIKNTQCQQNRWGSKRLSRPSLETASHKTYGGLSKGKRFYSDNSKRSFRTYMPKYICCQNHTSPTCPVSKETEIRCQSSCALASTDSEIKPEGCCRTPFGSKSQQSGRSLREYAKKEAAPGKKPASMWHQLQNENINRCSHLSNINHIPAGIDFQSGNATSENISQCIDISALLKYQNVHESTHALQGNSTGSIQQENTEDITNKGTLSTKCSNETYGKVYTPVSKNENPLILKENKTCLNNKEVQIHNMTTSTALPIVQDDSDSAEELEERVYMKPGSYQVPKKLLGCPINLSTQFSHMKYDTNPYKDSSQVEPSTSFSVIQSAQSPLSSMCNKSQSLKNKDTDIRVSSPHIKNIQHEYKNSPDMAWKAACASAETLLETLRGNITSSLYVHNEQLAFNQCENAESDYQLTYKASNSQNSEHEEHTQNENQEKHENQRIITPNSDKRKSVVRTDDWLIHTLNIISKSPEDSSRSQETETVTVAVEEKPDKDHKSDCTYTQESTKCTESSKHSEHDKTVQFSKPSALKNSVNKRAKDGKSTEERPTPRSRKSASGSSGKKSQIVQYHGADKNSSSSSKRKTQEKSPKDEESTNQNSKESSVKATQSNTIRKNKPDMRNKTSWNVWHSSQRRRGLSQMAVNKLESILNAVWDMEESDFVKYAIDSNKVRDYYKFVKHPMFLETIGNKLKNRIYETIEHFVHDFRRVFFNAKLYNKEDTFHYKLVKVLENKLDFLLDEHFSGWDLDYITGIPTEVASIPTLRYLSYVGDGNASKSRRSKLSNKAPPGPRKGAPTSTAQKQQK